MQTWTPLATADEALEPLSDELSWLPRGSTIHVVAGRLEIVLAAGVPLDWLVKKLRDFAPGIPYRMIDAATEEVVCLEASSPTAA